ncbi:hypothetical protein C2U72_10640 [Prosthecomicrobium hirschii]|uniref:HAD family hydrolase n=1 Tax=Prosthecodimorpha hirschii TaxID=665126 RepID=UPI00112EB035|nr:HAD family hydrolase [Prosthecomicrobium hirschii]TPQ50983.1 hypothetical protein C2U72_10640 [Prosthecomicrobium hirschii]
MRTVGFDYDGVLANSRSAAWNAAERILASFGMVASIDSSDAMEAAFGHAAQNALVGVEYAGALRMMHRLQMRHHARDFELFEDAIAVVAKIGVPRILVTAALADGVVTRLGSATRLFDEIVGFESGRKPDLLAQRAGKLGVYVTDAVSDIETCKALALPVIACTWGTYDNPKMLAAARPDAVANNAAELISAINYFVH